MKPTIQVPIKEIEPFAKRGLEFIKEENIKKWNEEVDEFWDDVEGKRHFWIGPLKYKTRDDVENVLGKPADGERGLLDTTWNRTRGATRQVIMYRHLLELFKNDPEKIVTMTVADYNTAMSFVKGTGSIVPSIECYNNDQN